MEQILSLEQLLQHVLAEKTDFFLYLGHGMKSSKSIAFTNEELTQISVYNEVDETEDFIDINQWEDSLLYVWINKGLLYKY